MKGSRKKLTRCYSPRVTLAAVGLKIGSLKLLDTVKSKVVILQKNIRQRLDEHQNPHNRRHYEIR